MITCDAANKSVSGVATQLATVLDSPEGIQPLREDSAYGSLSTLGDPSGVGGINGPDNINFGPDGYLYVGEKYGGRIIRIAGDGTHSVYATGFDNIEGVAFDPTTGDLYIGTSRKSRSRACGACATDARSAPVCAG